MIRLLGSIMLMLAFVSCTKKYECTCVVELNGSFTEVVEDTEAYNLDAAIAACELKNKTATSSSPMNKTCYVTAEYY